LTGTHSSVVLFFETQTTTKIYNEICTVSTSSLIISLRYLLQHTY